jgi:probable HAF family extracellular repeat protein
MIYNSRRLNLTTHRAGTTALAITATVIALHTPAHAAAGYTSEAIEPPPGSDATGAAALDDWGEVIGGYSAPGTTRPFVWSHDDGMTMLAEFPQSQNTEARDINNCGTIAGTATLVSSGAQRAVRWTSPTHIEDIGVYGPFELDGQNYYNATADAINDRGQIVGSTTSPARWSTAYRWTPGAGMQLLGTLGGDFSAAAGINKRGDVVGQSSLSNGEVHAFLWTDTNGMLDLGKLSYASASDVSDLRVVTGSYTTTTGATHAFRWTAATGMIDISSDSPRSERRSIGFGINTPGMIAGMRTVPNGDAHVALWPPIGGPIDLSGSAADSAVGTDVNLFGVVSATLSTNAEIPVIPTRGVIYKPPGYSPALVRAAKRAYECPRPAEH